MPTVSQFLMKAGMVWLVVSLVTRVVVDVGLLTDAVASAIRPGWWHLLVVGWLTQLIIAVAWWMFPTLSRDKRRGDDRVMWGVFAGLNLGLALRAVAEPLGTLGEASSWSSAIWLSAVLQAGALITAVVMLWPRVRPPRSKKRARKARTSADGG